LTTRLDGGYVVGIGLSTGLSSVPPCSDLSRGFVFVLVAFALGCGSDGERAVPGTPDPAHAREVDRNPYALTCGDLARQPLHPESQKLVIRAEFSLAREPSLRSVVAKETLNRTGRSVYFALTEICKTRRPSFQPAHLAVKAVRKGKYLAARNRPG
jgi:hypothetical protein